MGKSRGKLAKKILHEGRFLRLVLEGEWEYVQRHNCSGIVIIVSKTDDDKVIFVEQFRPPVNKSVIEFPAGLINDRGTSKNESLQAAARRELFEETGYRAQRIKILLHGPVSGGSSSDLITMVRAFGLKKVGAGGGDSTEKIKVHEVALAEAIPWLRRREKAGRLIEPKVYAGLYFLQNPT